VFVAFACAIIFTFFAVRIVGGRTNLLAGLSSDGRTTTGVITGVNETRRKGVSMFSLEYQYRVGGRSYTGSQIVSREEALAARSGNPLTVTYEPSSPGRSIGTAVAFAQADAARGSYVVYGAVAVVWVFAFWTLFAARNDAHV
jgi:hypothetical protein